MRLRDPIFLESADVWVLFKCPLGTLLLSLCVIAARRRSSLSMYSLHVLQTAACVLFKLMRFILINLILCFLCLFACVFLSCSVSSILHKVYRTSSLRRCQCCSARRLFSEAASLSRSPAVRQQNAGLHQSGSPLNRFLLSMGVL